MSNIIGGVCGLNRIENYVHVDDWTAEIVIIDRNGQKQK